MPVAAFRPRSPVTLRASGSVPHPSTTRVNKQKPVVAKRAVPASHHPRTRASPRFTARSASRQTSTSTTAAGHLTPSESRAELTHTGSAACAHSTAAVYNNNLAAEVASSLVECGSSPRVSNEEDEKVEHVKKPRSPSHTFSGCVEGREARQKRKYSGANEDNHVHDTDKDVSASVPATECSSERWHRTPQPQNPSEHASYTPETTSRTVHDGRCDLSPGTAPPRPSYAAVVTKRLPRSRTATQYVRGASCTSYPHLFIDIPVRVPVSAAGSPTMPTDAPCGEDRLAHGADEANESFVDTVPGYGYAREKRHTAPAGIATAAMTRPAGSHPGSDMAPASVTTAISSSHRVPIRGPFGAVEVIPGLFLGANSDAANLDALRENNVSLVLNVAAECTISSDLTKNTLGVRYVHLPLKDHSDETIAPYFLPVAQMIHAQLHRRAMGLQLEEEEAMEAQRHDACTNQRGAHTDEMQKDNGVESALLSQSTVSGHPLFKETRHETPHSATSQNLNSSRTSSYMVSPISTTTTAVKSAAPVNSTNAVDAARSSEPGRRRFEPTFPAGVEVSSDDHVVAQGTASLIQQLVPSSPVPAASAATTSPAQAAAEASEVRLSAKDCGGVLVHCRMGVSRSASFVIAYLILFGKELAHLSRASAAAHWLFRPGWEREDAQMLARIYAAQNRAAASPGTMHPRRPTSRHRCRLQDDTSSEDRGRREAEETPSASQSPQPWFSPMAPLTPRTRLQWEAGGRLSGRGQDGGVSPALASAGALPVILTTSSTTQALCGSGLNGAEGGDHVEHSGRRCDASPTQEDLRTPLHSSRIVSTATTTSPTTQATEGDVVYGPRQVAMSFCEPCFCLRSALVAPAVAPPATWRGGFTSLTASASFSTSTVATVVRGGTLSVMSPTFAQPAPVSIASTPIATAAATTTRSPVVDGAQDSSASTTVAPWWRPETTSHAASTTFVAGMVPDTSSSARTPRLFSGVHTEGCGGRIGSPCVTHTPLGSVTTTMTATGEARRDHPQLRLEMSSLGKVPVSFSSPTSFVSTSRTSLLSAAPVKGSGLSYSQAFHFLKSKKSNVNPNIGFVLALRELSGGEDDLSLSSSAQEC